MKFPSILIAAVLSIVASSCCGQDYANAERAFLDKYFTCDSISRVLLVHPDESGMADAFLMVKGRRDWLKEDSFKALIGKNGTGKTREGDARTPSGELLILSAFGILPNPGTSLEYTDITPSIFACDEDCEYYNRIIDTAEVHHRCKGEEMFAISPQYDWGLVTDYNPGNVYPLGSAIFIHCKGSKPWTGGCIAFDKEVMRSLVTMAGEGLAIWVDDSPVEDCDETRNSAPGL